MFRIGCRKRYKFAYKGKRSGAGSPRENAVFLEHHFCTWHAPHCVRSISRLLGIAQNVFFRSIPEGEGRMSMKQKEMSLASLFIMGAALFPCISAHPA